MSTREVSKETLRAIARLTGLDLSEGKLDELLPQVKSSVEAIGRLDALDLHSVEPAIVFVPDGE